MLGGLDLHTIAVAVKRALAAGYAYAAKGDIVSGTGAGTVTVNTVGTNGQVISADSSQPGGLVYTDNPSRPNLLINPNWQIDQINEGALYTYSAATAVGPDGWSGSATGAGVFKLRTVTDPESAALKCLEITCTTADAAIAAGDDYYIQTAVEGYDAAALLAGTASAQPATLQFKFKTNVLGVYGIQIANSAGNRRYIGIITVADTNEHEYSLSFTMDTAGTWLYTNGVGLYLRIVLAAGSTFQAAAGAWAAGAEQTTSAQCNFMSVNTNIAYLKRIQLIPGALVQAYSPADIQKALERAQRYFWKSFTVGTAPAQNVGTGTGELVGSQQVAAAAQNVFGAFVFPVQMRATPSIIFYNPAAANAQSRNETRANDNSATAVFTSNDKSFGVTYIGNGGASAPGDIIGVHATANARLS